MKIQVTWIRSLALLGCFVASCASSADSDGPELVGYLDSSQNLTALLLPDGQVLDRRYDLSATLEEWSSRQSGSPVAVRFESATAREGQSAEPLSIGFRAPATDLYFRLSFEKGFFAPIVRETCAPYPLPDRKLWHAGLMLKYYRGSLKEIQALNTHIIFWVDDATGRFCRANYTCVACRADDDGAAGVRTCTSTCGPGYNELVEGLAAAIVANFAVEEDAARTVAEIAVPVILGVATVTPGVPPPP